MAKKTKGKQRSLTPRRRLPGKRLDLLDRNKIAWQDPVTGVWSGSGSDTHLNAVAPKGFQVNAVLDYTGDSYLWVGINGDAPDVRSRVCYAVISGDDLRELASEILRYARNKGGDR